MNRTAKRRLVLTLACILFGCSLIGGYRFSSLQRIASEKPVSAPPQPSRVIFRIHYKNCGHTLEPASDYTIRPVEEILRSYPGARVTVLQDGGVEVVADVEGLCPEDAPYRLVCIKDGYVAVYYGRKPLEVNFKELRRDLPVERLSRRDVENLARGEIVPGDAAVARLLEGLLD